MVNEGPGIHVMPTNREVNQVHAAQGELLPAPSTSAQPVAVVEGKGKGNDGNSELLLQRAPGLSPPVVAGAADGGQSGEEETPDPETPLRQTLDRSSSHVAGAVDAGRKGKERARGSTLSEARGQSPSTVAGETEGKKEAQKPPSQKNSASRSPPDVDRGGARGKEKNYSAPPKKPSDASAVEGAVDDVLRSHSTSEKDGGVKGLVPPEDLASDPVVVRNPASPLPARVEVLGTDPNEMSGTGSSTGSVNTSQPPPEMQYSPSMRAAGPQSGTSSSQSSGIGDKGRGPELGPDGPFAESGQAEIPDIEMGDGAAGIKAPQTEGVANMNIDEEKESGHAMDVGDLWA
jgi:hypothetical protein